MSREKIVPSSGRAELTLVAELCGVGLNIDIDGAKWFVVEDDIIDSLMRVNIDETANVPKYKNKTNQVSVTKQQEQAQQGKQFAAAKQNKNG